MWSQTFRRRETRSKKFLNSTCKVKLYILCMTVTMCIFLLFACLEQFTRCQTHPFKPKCKTGVCVEGVGGLFTCSSHFPASVTVALSTQLAATSVGNFNLACPNFLPASAVLLSHHFSSFFVLPTVSY